MLIEPRTIGRPMASSLLKKIKIPHVFVLLSGVILVVSLLTYVVPSGHYERSEITVGQLTRTVMVPGTYEKVPKHISLESVVLGEEVEGKATPVSIVGLISAIPRGLETVADIVFLIFICGGVISVVNRTGTITAILQALLTRFSGSGPVLTVVLMTAGAIGGSTIGMGEELIPLVPIFLIVSQQLGYDRVYGFVLVFLGADVGFAAATTNPFTVQIAQGIAEVPLGSGIGFRVIFLVLILSTVIIYVLRYGRKIKKDPSKAIAPFDDTSVSTGEIEIVRLRAAHIWILLTCVVTFALILYLMQVRGWWLNEMSGGFILMGVLAVIISKIPVSEAVKAFIKGMEDMVVAAMVVGFARGIQVVLADGQILDTVIFSAANVLRNTSTVFAAQGMLVFQSILNFFIPSGSGQAAVTMPLMAPLSDILGITRQTAVFAFTCGDGFSNSIVPTGGVLMGMLALSKIPYEKWLRFMFPLFLILMLWSAIFLTIAVVINY
jgi:uncharacterized ion transporter superfamily protein YfcC